MWRRSRAADLPPVPALIMVLATAVAMATAGPLLAQVRVRGSQGQDSAIPRLPMRPAPAPGITVAAVGDIMLGSWVVDLLQREGPDYAFRALQSRWAGSDLVFGNLEAPFTDGGTPFDKKFTFRVPPSAAIGLKRAGFNVLSIANNHIMDYGVEGLKSTLSTLRRLDIATAGADTTEEAACFPAYLTLTGKRVALLAYSLTFPVEFYARADTAGTCFPRRLEEQVRAARRVADFVIVSFHWGAEKQTTPKPYQIEAAHRAIDAGADLVLGHHPHVLQGLEVYHNRLIAYSLGNFAFGSYSSAATVSILLKVYLDRRGLVFARCIPINVKNVEVEFQPRQLVGAAGDSVLVYLNRLSRDLNGDREILSGRGIVLGEVPLLPVPFVTGALPVQADGTTRRTAAP